LAAERSVPCEWCVTGGVSPELLDAVIVEVSDGEWPAGTL
jgi:hypothetical protein